MTDTEPKSATELSTGEDATSRTEYGTRSFESAKARLDLDGGVNATVVYHDDCHDGITAAWVAQRAFPASRLYAASYGKPVDFEALRGRDVILVDFCWPYETMVAILRDFAATLTVLDHHVSAKTEVLQPLLRYQRAAMTANAAALNHSERNYIAPLCVVYDVNRSGAGITWDTLFPNEPRPDMVNWVEARDLWRFDPADNRPRAFHAYAGTLPLTLTARQQLFELTANAEDQRRLLAAGEAVLRSNDLLVRDIVARAEVYSVCLPDPNDTRKTAWYAVPVAVVPSKSLISEVGAVLAPGFPFALVIVDVRPMFGAFGGDYEEVYLSFRSADRDDAADVSRIASALGGGGHKRAAGARVTASDLARSIHRTGRRVFPL